MNNKETIEILNRAKPINDNPPYNILCIAVDKAIASLEAWDKVKEELEKDMNEYEKEMNEYEKLSDLSYSDGVSYALDVIEEHLKEV